MAATGVSSDHNAVKVFHWVRWGNGDYLAARTLLAAKMLVHGAGLANTAIEKYLKGLCANRSVPIPKSHAVHAIYSTVKQVIGQGLTLNVSFLHFLEKAYAMRYSDQLKDGFNLALNEMKILAELDRTVGLIMQRFVLNDADRKAVLQYDTLTKTNDYSRRNVVVMPEQRESFFKQPSTSFEYRVVGQSFLEVDYLSPYVLDDGNFDCEGFKSNLKTRSPEFAFPHGRIKAVKRLL